MAPPRKPKRPCPIVDDGQRCGRPITAKGLCKKHYLRLLKHGDPNVNKNRDRTVRARWPAPLLDNIRPQADGCWLWTGLILKSTGYGQVRLPSGRQVGAHVASYAHYVGLVPEGAQVHHKCEVHACVNPAHLEPLTPAEHVHRHRGEKKTHCPKGHPYSGDNLYLTPEGGRVCKACKNAGVQAWRDRGGQRAWRARRRQQGLAA